MKRTLSFESPYDNNICENAVIVLNSLSYSCNKHQLEEKIYFNVAIYADQDSMDADKLPLRVFGGETTIVDGEDFRITALKHVATLDGFEGMAV